jgi:chemotaxis protein CheZ
MTTQPDSNLDAALAACRDFARYIAKARREIAQMRPHDLRAVKLPHAGQELNTIVEETEAATHTIMEAAEAMMALDSRDGANFKQAVDAQCLRVFEACSFQDITGQRIRKVVATLTLIEDRLHRLQRILGPDVRDADPDHTELKTGDAALAQGPQRKGQGIDQAAIDRLLSD